MRQSRLLDGLTTDLLVAAQARRGTLRVEPRAVDLAAVVGTVVQDADRAGLVAEIEDTRPVLADPLRLEQMLTNLISNAFKYGTPPVVVRVQPADDPDATTVEVVDAGGGVPPDFAGQLFDEFARAPGIGAGGTGLGLYVVRMLAEAHGGSVTYEPAPGGGSVFRITLPVA
jgi:signal transduction histidine kinase